MKTLITREMIRAGTFVDIAKHSADGLQGLKPTIWTVDGGNETFKSLVPYIKLVSDAVGIKMPSEKQ
jgi:hypothetical protein